MKSFAELPSSRRIFSAAILTSAAAASLLTACGSRQPNSAASVRPAELKACGVTLRGGNGLDSIDAVADTLHGLDPNYQQSATNTHLYNTYGDPVDIRNINSGVDQIGGERVIAQGITKSACENPIVDGEWSPNPSMIDPERVSRNHTFEE